MMTKIFKCRLQQGNIHKWSNKSSTVRKVYFKFSKNIFEIYEHLLSQDKQHKCFLLHLLRCCLCKKCNDEISNMTEVFVFHGLFDKSDL